MQLPTPDSLDLLKPDAAAALLQLSEATLKKWRSIGIGLAYLKLGDRVFYQITDLRAWLATRRQGGDPARHTSPPLPHAARAARTAARQQRRQAAHRPSTP